jgi:hypothetical protein
VVGNSLHRSPQLPVQAPGLNEVREMVTWQRTLTIYVDAPESWLIEADLFDPPGYTDDMVIEAEAWDEIVEDVRKAIKSVYGPIPTFDVDWGDMPQRKED